MRAGLPGLALVLLALAPRAAPAQVTVNPGALDLLQKEQLPRPAAPTRPSARPRPAPKPAAKPADAKPPEAKASPAPAAPAVPAPAAAARPVIPVTPPAVAALPPPAPLPAARAQALPEIPVSLTAPGEASAVPGGLRVTFGADRHELNPATVAALRQLAVTLKPLEQRITIYGYAAGSPDDPSTARRLALGRALAARAVLLNEGIASTRIYPRAEGVADPAAGAVPDRVDVLTGASTSPAGAPR